MLIRGHLGDLLFVLAVLEANDLQRTIGEGDEDHALSALEAAITRAEGRCIRAAQHLQGRLEVCEPSSLHGAARVEYEDRRGGSSPGRVVRAEDGVDDLEVVREADFGHVCSGERGGWRGIGMGRSQEVRGQCAVLERKVAPSIDQLTVRRSARFVEQEQRIVSRNRPILGIRDGQFLAQLRLLVHAQNYCLIVDDGVERGLIAQVRRGKKAGAACRKLLARNEVFHGAYVFGRANIGKRQE
ncbi:MAG: hypothetical protein RL385_2154 [Pseudomonadota bacterium]|jgi:hypothetical protein